MICTTFAVEVPTRAGSVDVGAVVKDARRLCDMSHKEFCLLMGDVDAGQWSNAISNRGALDLWKMARLPWRFWSVFIPLFVSAHATAWLADVRAEFGR